MGRTLLVLVGAVLVLTSLMSAQGRGDYFNVESPQGHPIELFSLDGHDYLAVCNTRNNSVEIWDTDETAAQRRLVTMRVGLEPVSVRFNARLSRLYTVNFLGDSVSVIHLAARNGPSSLGATMIETTWIGDEPIDLAFYELDEGGSTRETFLVTHMAADGFGWRDADTLDPVNPGTEMMPAVVTVGVDTDSDDLVDDFVDRAIKEPRSVRVAGDDVLILALKGGDNEPPSTVPVMQPNAQSPVPDMDLYCDDLNNLGVNPLRIHGLGTTGLNMAFDAAGVLYVVGGEALNDQLQDEPNVAAAATGFFKSMFYRIDGPCSGVPTIRGRDVNLEPALQQVPFGAGSPQGLGAEPLETRPVTPSKALSMLTDVVAFDGGGSVPKVFFTALSNDRIGVIEPDPAEPDSNRWEIRRIDVAPMNGNPLAGPNGLALKLANAGQSNDPGDRLYVLNHFDNSITTIDPVTETVVVGGQLSLAHDPRPDHLKLGQRFLYDSKLSGNHFVSCASCHLYGRTDGLIWDLGTPGAGDVPVPDHLPDALNETHFPEDKGFLVTQSLQGLLNYEVSPEDQEWVTNAPYHWRGDRETFLDFRAAFESLLGGPELSEDDMEDFEEFVNTIQYPPNPKQPRDRVASGDFGVGEDLTIDGSTRAQRGLKIFHVERTVGPRSCVLCHALPESSNNRLTDGGPIETAATRGLYQKEAKRDIDGYSDTELSPYTGREGLFHDGIRGFTSIQHINTAASINGFNLHFFSNVLCGQNGQVCGDLQDLNQFGHEFDWGAGPLIGCPMTVDQFNFTQAYSGGVTASCSAACTDMASTLDCMEQQAQVANNGLVVQKFGRGAVTGYRYDPITDRYLEEPGGAAHTRDEVIDDRIGRQTLVWAATALGDESRVVSPDGVPADDLPGPAPSSIELLPMVPGTFYERVPELTQVYATLDNSAFESIFLHTLRLYQWGLIQDASTENGFGVGTDLHHDAPRRFQVVGNDIRYGATLALSYHDDPNAGPPNPNLGLNQFAVDMITLPLHPTNKIDTDTGLPIWQTAVELDPITYYGLMLGGENAPGVTAAFFDPSPFSFPMQDPILDQPPLGSFSPLRWNWIWVTVVNANGMVGDGGWQRLRVE